MARVANDWQAGDASAEFYRDLPHWKIAIDFLVIAGEAPVDGGKTLYASLIDALHSSNPQLQIRVHGVFDQHRDVHSLQTVGYCLHCKGVG